MRKLIVFISLLFLFSACSGGKLEDLKHEENKETIAFRLIDITLEDDQVNISGEMKSWDGSFYFHVLSGEEIIIEENKIDTGQVNYWWEFEVTLSKSKLQSLTGEVPFIVLYGKDSSGKDIQPNYVPIDLE